MISAKLTKYMRNADSKYIGNISEFANETIRNDIEQLIKDNNPVLFNLTAVHDKIEDEDKGEGEGDDKEEEQDKGEGENKVEGEGEGEGESEGGGEVKDEDEEEYVIEGKGEDNDEANEEEVDEGEGDSEVKEEEYNHEIFYRSGSSLRTDDTLSRIRQ